jgi:hypothetical protein
VNSSRITDHMHAPFCARIGLIPTREATWPESRVSSSQPFSIARASRVPSRAVVCAPFGIRRLTGLPTARIGCCITRGTSQECCAQMTLRQLSRGRSFTHGTRDTSRDFTEGCRSVVRRSARSRSKKRRQPPLESVRYPVRVVFVHECTFRKRAQHRRRTCPPCSKLTVRVTCNM